jgi:hypothetical protein
MCEYLRCPSSGHHQLCSPQSFPAGSLLLFVKVPSHTGFRNIRCKIRFKPWGRPWGCGDSYLRAVNSWNSSSSVFRVLTSLMVKKLHPTAGLSWSQVPSFPFAAMPLSPTMVPTRPANRADLKVCPLSFSSTSTSAWAGGTLSGSIE